MPQNPSDFGFRHIENHDGRQIKSESSEHDDHGGQKGVSYATSISKLVDGLTLLKKHTLTIESILDKVDNQRRIYPNGVFSSVRESNEESRPLKRIELFAEKEDGQTKDMKMYGIIRTLSVAFSSEKSLLELANASNSVISVRTLKERNGERRVLEDKLILRCAGDSDGREVDGPLYRARVPNLFVSPHWLERMNLEGGDCIIISNPLENYMIPPPQMLEKELH